MQTQDQNLLTEAVLNLTLKLNTIERVVNEIHGKLATQHLDKEWYSTAEAAEILGKSRFTIQEKWCNQGRIRCEKDPETGKWRIPRAEIERLRNGIVANGD